MGFSRSQQADYRPLVAAAWAAHAAANRLDPRDRVAERAWYESALMDCVGAVTTVPLDRGRDYDQAMAHFEALADNGSTYWQQRAETGDYRRICWTVFRSTKPAIDGVPLTAEYLRGIARQALNLDIPPALRSLSKPQLKVVIRSLAIHARRHSISANLRAAL